MADKSFGVRELNLTNTSGTPTVSSPNQLNLSAHTVAISTSVTVGQNLTVSANAGISSLNVTGIGTVLNLNVLGVGTITSPSDANAHSRWKVTNQSASAYRFTGPGQDGSENNPNVYLVRGQRYIFDVNASGHPFQLRVANGGAAYSDGVTNNGAQSGQVIFNVQHDAPAQLYYQCTNHGSMVGNIYIVGGPQVISGVLTATSFSGSGANLTSIPAGQLTGTVADARISTLTASKLSGALPAISGANLTNLPAQATIANNADNRVITGGSGVNLNGESGATYDGTDFTVSSGRLKLTDESSGAQFRLGAGSDFQIEHDGSNSYIYNNTNDLVIQNDANVKITAKTGGTQRFRFDTDGLKFGTDTAAANALDDYEEGVHQTTVTISGNTSFSYSNRNLAYTKIGRLVHVVGRILLTGAGGGSTFSFTLPFTNGNGVQFETSNIFQIIRGSANRCFRIRTNQSVASLETETGGSSTDIGASDPHINVNLTYFTPS